MNETPSSPSDLGEDPFFRLMEGWAQAVWEADAGGVVTSANAGWSRVTGQPLDELLGSGWLEAVHPDDRAHAEREWRASVTSGTNLDTEYRLLSPGGRYRWSSVRALPLLNEDGSIRKWVGINIDITDRKRAEAALCESETRLRTLVDGIPQLIFRSTSDGKRTWVSSQWVEFTGLTSDQSLGLGWLEAVHPDDRQATAGAWEGAEERGDYGVEHRIFHAPSASYRAHQTRAIPLRAMDGSIIDWLGTSTDIEHKHQLQQHQSRLMAELQHRVRNTLAVIRSIARRTAQGSSDVDDFMSHFEGRLNAFARVQAAVTINPDGGVDLGRIVADELTAVATREGEQLQIDGPPVQLERRIAESISLALHELATNAIKFGALAADKGRVSVHWQRRPSPDGEQLHLEWRESGLEHPPQAGRIGFGYEMLQRSLPYELDAETEIELGSTGLRFTLTMPLGPGISIG